MAIFGEHRSAISPRKQLWIKAVKKLTSERLGREGLAAWEDRKSNADPEIVIEPKDISQEPAEDVEAAKAEPEAAEQAVTEEEAPTQRGTKVTSAISAAHVCFSSKRSKCTNIA